MRRPRKGLVSLDDTPCYRCVSRGVRRAFEGLRFERAHRVPRVSARQGFELPGGRSPSLTGPDPPGIYACDVRAERA